MKQSIANKYLLQIKLPKPNSHKGQNGKLLIIGGSKLFHAASKWSLDVASKFVDMVFYSSIPSNNQLVQTAKGEFWNGIVIERSDLADYIDEADCILIGPGMTRDRDTQKLTNSLLEKYPSKRWVIDAGALQMANPYLLGPHSIITPHAQELKQLCSKINSTDQKNISICLKWLVKNKVTILLKGPVDQIFDSQLATPIEIKGGNAGMTKGGTGDVLAGLVAGLYSTQDKLAAVVVASYINKKAGESLYKNVGPFFNASDLAREVPKVFWRKLQQP